MDISVTKRTYTSSVSMHATATYSNPCTNLVLSSVRALCQEWLLITLVKYVVLCLIYTRIS
jgi:uncharacterized membrane protein